MDGLAYVNLQLTLAELTPDVFVLTATGELDVFSAGRLERELQRLRGRKPRCVIVDLTSVPLIDSVVLGVLMSHAKLVRRNQGEFVLVSDDPRTVRVIEITGLGYLFTLAPSLAAAVAMTNGRAA